MLSWFTRPRNQGRSARALDAMHTAIAMDPQLVYHSALHNEALNQHQPQQALPHIEACLARRPDIAHFHFLRGCILDMSGNPEEACAAFRTTIELEPCHELAHSYLALALPHREAECVHAATMALTLDPDSAPAALALVQARWLQPRNAPALLKLLADWLRPDGSPRLGLPRQARQRWTAQIRVMRGYRGLVTMHTPRWKTAWDDLAVSFADCIANPPDVIWMGDSLVQHCLGCDDYDRADFWLRMLHSLPAAEYRAAVCTGEWHLAQKQTGRAEQHFRKALAAAPSGHSHDYACAQLAWTAWHRGDPAAAAAHVAEASQDDDCPELLQIKAQLALTAGDLGAAHLHANELAAHSDVTALHILGLSLQARGRHAEADHCFRKAIRRARAGYRLNIHERKRVQDCKRLLNGARVLHQ